MMNLWRLSFFKIFCVSLTLPMAFGSVALAQDSTSQRNGNVLSLTINGDSRASIRMFPSISGSVVGTLASNKNVEVIGKPNGRWVPVKDTATGNMGWVHVSQLASNTQIDGNKDPLQVAEGHSVSAQDARSMVLTYQRALRSSLSAQSTQETSNIESVISPATGNPLSQTEAGITEYCEACRVSQSARPPRVDLQNILAPEGRDYVMPFTGSYRITGHFHEARSSTKGRTRLHKGVDFSMPRKTPLMSVQDGVVITAGRQRGYGVVVAIQHANGWVSKYAHLTSANVRVGQQVRRGQYIARSGNTGRSSGPHLHLEIRRDGEWGPEVNPIDFINQR